jgi:hypothetical protein
VHVADDLARVAGVLAPRRRPLRPPDSREEERSCHNLWRRQRGRPPRTGSNCRVSRLGGPKEPWQAGFLIARAGTQQDSSPRAEQRPAMKHADVPRRRQRLQSVTNRYQSGYVVPAASGAGCATPARSAINRGPIELARVMHMQLAGKAHPTNRRSHGGSWMCANDGKLIPNGRR